MVEGLRVLAPADAEPQLAAQWGAVTPTGSSPSPLVFPFSAQWTEFGTCLVADRCHPDNQLLEVSLAGEVIWSHRASPRMNFAHRVDADTVLFLQGGGIWSIGGQGRAELRCRLPTDSHLNSASILGDRIAVAADDGIFLLTLDGRLIRRLAPDPGSFVEAVDVELLPGGHLLVVDAYGTCTVELDGDGRRVTTFGSWRHQSPDRSLVTVPASACRLADGRTVVADWRSGALLAYDPAGRPLDPLPSRGRAVLFGPSYVRQIRGGALIVTESGSRRVSLRTVDGEVRWEFGPESLPLTDLHFPRTAQPLPGGELLVCDSYADRVMVLDRSGHQRWMVGPGGDADPGLTLPRAAARTPAGGDTAVADGLNGRVVVVGPAGRTTREVDRVWSGGKALRLQDPHYAELIGQDGGILLVDADLGRVMVIDERDSVVTKWGVTTRLRYPRCARLLPDGSVLVVDTNACRVVAVDGAGRIKWQVGPRFGVADFPTASPELRTPKWAAFDKAGRLVIADYYNSRVVAVALPAGVGQAAGRRT